MKRVFKTFKCFELYKKINLKPYSFFQISFGKFDALGQGKEQLGLVGTNNDINQKQN